jgi:hypothetical protein
MDATYPNLGFNPVPGVPERVEAMGAKVTAAVDSMGQAGDLLGQLRNADSEVWQGDAGDAFRAHFNDKLATDLANAHTSLNNAVEVVRGWHTDLLGFKDAAAKLDQEAADAKRRLADANGALDRARSNPDLLLAGRTFASKAEAAAAQARLDAASSAVNTANAAAQTAQADLESILERAQELENQHSAAAAKAANELENATSHLAPHKPGLFSSLWNGFTSALSAVGDWVKNHLSVIHSILSTISAIAGLVALCTPPPIDAIAFGVAAVAGLGALATDLANPQFRAGMGQLFTGHFNKASLGAGLSGFGDVMGVIPGVGIVRGLAAGGKGLEIAAEEAPTVTQIVSAVAKRPGLAVRLLANDGSALVNAGGKLMSSPLGTAIADNAGVVFRDGAEGATDGAKYGANLIWKGRTVATDIYKDVKKAVA